MKRQITLTLLPIVLLISFLTFGHIAIAAPGDLDPTFGVGGKVTDWQGYARAVAIQSDGKIVTAGQSTYNGSFSSFALTRYNSDGSIDASFGFAGRVLTGFGSNSYANSVAIQTDGKIVSAGIGLIGTNNYHFALARYNPDGSLDTSFDGDGKVTTVVGTSGWDDEARSVTIQPDGRIVVAGLSYIGEGNTSISLARYNTNGSLDTSFDGDGKVVTPIGPSYDVAISTAIQLDGKILAVGYSNNGSDADFALVRYNANGSVDTTFGGNGVVITPLGTSDDIAFSVALQDDGRIVTAGFSSDGTNGDFALVRYNTDGSPDTTFDGDGKLTTPIGTLHDFATDVVIQSDGKIVASGTSYNGSNNDYALARYLPNGLLDATFGDGDGKTTVDFNNTDDYAAAMALDDQGRAVVVGGFLGSSFGAFALARFILEPGTVSTRAAFDFDGDGRSDVAVFRPSEATWYLDRSLAGFTAAKFGLGTDNLTPADLDGDGKTDIAVFRGGVWYWLSSMNGGFNSYQFGIGTDVPVGADFTGDGRAELAIYRNGVWWEHDLASGADISLQFGLNTDIPMAADFDGDGRADEAVYREGTWFINQSTAGFKATQFGIAGDKLVPADYDGDRTADPAVFRGGTWYILGTQTGFRAVQFGVPTDIPVPADYDGDGTTDIAVFRPSEGNWYQLKSTAGFSAVHFGSNADRPVGGPAYDPTCHGCWDY